MDFFCKDCSLQFGKKYVYDLHLKLVHGEKIEVKNEPLNSEETFKEHQTSEDKISDLVVHKFIECNICDATFNTQQNLKIHTNSVHEVKNKPIISEETFQEPQIGEKEHLVVHKPIKCNICSAPFKTQGKLNRHTNSVHKGKKPIICNICDASFSQKQGLNKHIASVHEKKKPFKCDICDASFSLKVTLNGHIAAVHEGKKPFTCSICDGNFASKQRMNTHLASAHEGNVQKC